MRTIQDPSLLLSKLRNQMLHSQSQNLNGMIILRKTHIKYQELKYFKGN